MTTRPGARLRALAARMCSEAALHRWVDPAIADLQHEHAELLRHGRRWRAAWARVAACLRIVQLVALHDAGSRGRALTVSGAAICIPTAVLVLAIVGNTPGTTANPLLLAAYLLPATLPLTVPCGLTLAWACRRARTPATRTVLTCALGGAILVCVSNAWLLPYANQQYRRTAAGRDVILGCNELTLPQLHRRLSAQTRGASIGVGAYGHDACLAVETDVPDATFNYQERIALAATSIALALFVLSLTGYGALLRIVAASTVCGIYLWFALLPRPLATLNFAPPALVAWVPDLFTLLIACSLLAFEHGRQGSADAAH